MIETGDFEGWSHKYGWELALAIDNNSLILDRVLALVGECIDRKHGNRIKMVYEFIRRLWAHTCILEGGVMVSKVPRYTGMYFEGWVEVFEHYEAKVRDMRRHALEKYLENAQVSQEAT